MLYTSTQGLELDEHLVITHPGICLPTVAISSLIVSSKVSVRAKADGIPNSWDIEGGYDNTLYTKLISPIAALKM